MTGLAVYSLQSLSTALAPQMSAYGSALGDTGARPVLIGFASGHSSGVDELLPDSVSGNKYGPAPLKGRTVLHWDGDENP